MRQKKKQKTKKTKKTKTTTTTKKPSNMFVQRKLKSARASALSDLCPPLRKHAYSNIVKILPPKNEKVSDKNTDIFHISAQNIDFWYSLEPPLQFGSNEYQQSLFLKQK